MGKATIIEAQNSDTVYEKSNSKGILGKLKGVFADFRNGTRNSDRLYCEELWDNRVFNNEDVMEALETKTLFGELDHPEGDRCETLAKNAAVSITKLEKDVKNGVILGEAEILDTPTGRIVKALADSGAKLGISSRGMGEEIYSEGRNLIDPETYDFITFDVVVTPANTKARVSLTESKKISMLTESIKKEINDSETNNQLNQIKKVVETTKLTNKSELLNLLEYKESKLKKESKISNKLQEANKSAALHLMKAKLLEQAEELKTLHTADSHLAEENLQIIGERDFFKESKNNLKEKLKESLKTINEQKKYIQESDEKFKALAESTDSLKEKLAKNTQVSTKIESFQANKMIKLQEENKQLREENIKLNENLKTQRKIILENKKLKERISELEAQNSKILTEGKNRQLQEVKDLKEQIRILKDKNNKIEEAQDRFSKLSFNPIGHVKARTENFMADDDIELSQEDLNLYNALI